MLGAKRAVLAPSEIAYTCFLCGWTKAQPYGHNSFPPFPVSAILSAGLKPAERRGSMMLGAKRVLLAPSEVACIQDFCG